jgi:hypothetical protein
VEDAFPVADVLFSEWGVEAEGMTSGGYVGGWSAFAEHLLDGISGDEVNHQKDEGDDQPDDWESVEDALEDRVQFSVVSG